MQCRVYTTQLGRHYEDIKAAGYEVLVILGNTIDRARSYSDLLHVPFPVLADPERAVYHQYGLGKSMIVIQQTASVVIDREGVIRYHRQAANPNEWLSEIQRLLQFVKSQPRTQSSG